MRDFQPSSNNTIMTLGICIVFAALQSGTFVQKVASGAILMTIILTILAAPKLYREIFSSWKPFELEAEKERADKLQSALSVLTTAINRDNRYPGDHPVSTHKAEAQLLLNIYSDERKPNTANLSSPQPRRAS
jgi:hypothetical protein